MPIDPTDDATRATGTGGRFRKKPIEISAVRFDGTNFDEVAVFAGPNPQGAPWTVDTAVFIPTLEGVMRCDVGDWVICGVAGEFYPCKPDIFAASYDLVEPDLGDVTPS